MPSYVCYQSPKNNISETLRALYLSDNDFEYFPGDVQNLKNLQILALRENDLVALPKEIGNLTRLRELHIQVPYSARALIYWILTRF